MRFGRGLTAVALAIGIAASAGSQPIAPRSAIMARAAQHFLATLSPAQRSIAMRSLADEPARTGWHYLPDNVVKRRGLPLGDLAPDQRKALHAMLTVALSSQGYGKLTRTIWLEELLHASEREALARSDETGEAREQRKQRLRSRDPELYFVTVFGDPAGPDWGWTLDGHHFAVNFTVVKGQVAFTPMFLGANPQTIPAGAHAGERSMQQAVDKAFRLAAALGAPQRAVALVSATTPDNFPADKGQPLPADGIGIAADHLDPPQRRLLSELLDEFVGDTAEETAARQMRAIERDGWSKLRLAWWGSMDDPERRFLVRVHGPSILVELFRERMPDGSPANHLHAIVRDPRNDYGADWLGRHYREHHSTN